MAGNGCRCARAPHYFPAVGPEELETGVGGVPPHPQPRLHFTVGLRARTARSLATAAGDPCAHADTAGPHLLVAHGQRVGLVTSMDW